jgi:hypothetical protein
VQPFAWEGVECNVTAFHSRRERGEASFPLALGYSHPLGDSAVDCHDYCVAVLVSDSNNFTRHVRSMCVGKDRSYGVS